MNTLASPFRVLVGPTVGVSAPSAAYVGSLKLARLVRRTQRAAGRTATIQRLALVGPGRLAWQSI